MLGKCVLLKYASQPADRAVNVSIVALVLHIVYNTLTYCRQYTVRLLVLPGHVSPSSKVTVAVQTYTCSPSCKVNLQTVPLT